MSCGPPVSGRVSAIKSQFENLTNLESPDISGNKIKKPEVKFQFQRANTSVDLLKRSEKAHSLVNTWIKNETVPKQTSDSALLKHKSKSQLKEKSTHQKKNKEKIEVKLSRHTSDPVKRSSIKRSPAFRIGDKQNKTVLLRHTHVATNEFDNKKFEDFLENKCSSHIERLKQPGLTDSVKAALRKPLPCGPPPKKPPRTFGSPSQEKNPVQIFEEQEQVEENLIKGKISFLENNLVISKNPPRKPSPLQKSKTEFILHGSKLLDCISCHRVPSMVYDSVDTEERKPLILHNIDKCFLEKTSKSEPIYMEPFGHLKRNKSASENVFLEDETDSSHQTSRPFQQSSNKENFCSCPETHRRGDLHYMCTAIDESIGESDCVDKEGNISLGKTYDEISILVDAAFQQKPYEKESRSSAGNISDENIDNKSSIKLSRTLTEKRKDYVRRIAVMPEKRIQTYGTLHRTFKSPIVKTFSLEEDEGKSGCENSAEKKDKGNIEQVMTTSDRIDKYKKLVEDNNSNINLKMRSKLSNRNVEAEVDSSLASNIDDDFNTQKMFQICLLCGYNTSNNCAYVKWKYPPKESVPDNIEQLVFPSSDIIRNGRENQEYCLILTDDNGFKVYGYCRRVLPENSEMCLPLCYCLISVTKALGFYQKLLKEIESRHGQSESQINFLLSNLQNSQIPSAGKYLHVKLPLSVRPKTFFSSSHKISPKRLSLEANPKWLTESAAQAAFAEQDFEVSKSGRKSSGPKSLVQEYEDKKQSVPFDLGLINRSLIMRDPKFDEILIRRPNDLRLENTELSELLVCLGPENVISVFSSLLLERKVILQSKNISLLTKSVLALQTILYPFQWQYTIVTILPRNLIEICQAPFPVLAGILEHISFEIEDGVVVDLDSKRITQSCGDEQTIIPNSLQESLQLSLEMVDLIDQGKMLSSVLISEAFLRFFVELFGDYNQKYFHKEEFIQCHESQNVKFFLEWFVETSMFRHFCNDRYIDENTSSDNFYKLFDARLMEKSENKSKTLQNIETIVKNSKIINKKGKTFKERFKGFLHNN